MSDHCVVCGTGGYVSRCLTIVLCVVQVAIKIIDRSKLKEDYQKEHLHREARILGQLRHPNIVRLYETLKVRSHTPTHNTQHPNTPTSSASMKHSR